MWRSKPGNALVRFIHSKLFAFFTSNTFSNMKIIYVSLKYKNKDLHLKYQSMRACFSRGLTPRALLASAGWLRAQLEYTNFGIRRTPYIFHVEMGHFFGVTFGFKCRQYQTHFVGSYCGILPKKHQLGCRVGEEILDPGTHLVEARGSVTSTRSFCISGHICTIMW